MITLAEEKQLVVQIDEQIVHAAHADRDQLQARLKTIKEIKNRLQARKEEITKPMREALQSARDLFRPLEERLEAADTTVRGFLLQHEEKRERDQAKLAGMVESGKVSMDDATGLMVPESKGLFRIVKKMVITKKSLIPDKYWIIDEVALRAALMEGKRIAGAQLVEEKTVVSR